MIELDVLENKSDILIVLLIIYFGSVMFSILIKWIYPFFKEYATLNAAFKKVDSDEDFTKICDVKLKNNCKKTGKKLFNAKNSDCSNENFESLIDELKLLVAISQISSEESNKTYRNNNFLNDLTLSIQRAVNKRRVLKHKLQEKMCSSETQTNITINPQMKVDNSVATVVLSHVSSVIPMESSTSCDQFESASSGNSDSEYSDCEYFPVLRHLGCCDLLHKNTNVASRIEQRIKVCSKELNSSIESNLVSSLDDDYSKRVSKENKILEMAITEFERELKPIRDQIKVLKECLDGVDICDTQYSLPSGFTSSVTSTERQSETFSTTISTTCDTNRFGCASSQCTSFAKNSSPFKTPDKLFEISIGKTPLAPSRTGNDFERVSLKGKYSTAPNNKPISDIKTKCHSPLEVSKLKKRSPLAEMYIQLSQSNSQSTSFLKKKKHEVVLQSTDSKTVTCHINLNVTLGAVSSANVRKADWIKDREMLPIVSTPEDLLGDPSNTHISLKPALKL